MKEKWHGRGPWSGVFGPWNGNGKWGTGGTGAPHPYMRLPLKSDSRSKGPLRLGEPTSVSRTEDFTSYTEVDPGADITVAARYNHVHGSTAQCDFLRLQGLWDGLLQW
jgi:hypothetical protein